MRATKAVELTALADLFLCEEGRGLGQLRGFTIIRHRRAEPGLGMVDGEKSSVWSRLVELPIAQPSPDVT